MPEGGTLRGRVRVGSYGENGFRVHILERLLKERIIVPKRDINKLGLLQGAIRC